MEKDRHQAHIRVVPTVPEIQLQSSWVHIAAVKITIFVHENKPACAVPINPACNPADRDATERSGGYMSALDGFALKAMIIRHALSECVRLRRECTALRLCYLKSRAVLHISINVWG